MSSFQTVRYTKEGAVATIMLDRPQVVNAYNVQMRDDLFQVLEAVRDDPEVRGVLLHGAGPKGFCSGADLTEFGTTPSQMLARWVRWERDVWGLLAGLPQPTVVAIHGYCLGVGVEMACLCDFRVASEDAVLGLPEVLLGMVPAAGGTQSLARAIGAGPAMELTLTGRRIDAHRALSLGLVTMVTPPERLLEEARSLLLRVLEQPSAVLEAAKLAVSQGMEMPLTHALEMEHRRASAVASESLRS
jgi:enoyl-CoA hydratase